MIVEKLVANIEMPLTFEKPRYHDHDDEVIDDRETNIYQSISKAHNSAVLCIKTCISMYPFSEKKGQLDRREMHTYYTLNDIQNFDLFVVIEIVVILFNKCTCNSKCHKLY